MVFCDVNDPSSLFETFWEKMSEDYEHQLTTIANVHPELQKWMLLIDIKERLKSSGNSQFCQMICTVTAEMQLAVSNARRQYNQYGECREVREELAYDREEMQHSINVALNGEGPNQAGKFTPSQRREFHEIK